VDWTDATLGDRHFDVSRTLVLFGVASVAARSTAERAALRAIAPALRRWFRSAYEAERPLDPRRLAFWSAAHLLRGWQQVRELHATAGRRTEAAGAVPAELAPRLLRMAEGEAAALR
jgi:aminoglycoside phosphotransferase (APT) family kinase protein